MSVLDVILSKLKRVKKSGKGWVAICPAHDDKTPSLSIIEGADGKAVLCCHAGCKYNDIMGAIGLDPKDGFVDGIDKTLAIEHKIKQLSAKKTHEELVIAAGEKDLQEGILTDKDEVRLDSARKNIGQISNKIRTLEAEAIESEKKKNLTKELEYENLVISSLDPEAEENILTIAQAHKRIAEIKSEISQVQTVNAGIKSAKGARGNPIFSPLGYNELGYYYLVHATGQIMKIPSGSHTNVSLMLSIAPLEWLEMTYPKEKGGADWHVAANTLMRMCENVGIYSKEIERGRGAWYDNGKPVLHIGGYLMVDGVKTEIHDFKTKFIYTKKSDMDDSMANNPANCEQAGKISALFDDLRFSNPAHAKFLAGWCALAPICGALKWRPHVWLTAQRGAGKSWIQDRMITPLLGKSALVVQGGTTEAGIRQRLRQDARPIVFDEAESDDIDSQRRIKMVIELARHSSSENSSEIIKGGQNGDESSFRMRSMFLLGSINISLSRASDLSRFSVLELKNPEKTKDASDYFRSFSRSVENTITEQAASEFRFRIYKMIPEIRENADILATSIAEISGSRRAGDQIGALLAGWYATKNDGIISVEESKRLAEEILSSRMGDFIQFEEESDEESCLNKILECQISFDSDHGRLTRTVEEVILCAAGKSQINGVFYKDANKILLRHGLKLSNIDKEDGSPRIIGNRLVISNNHRGMIEIMRGTAWAVNWRNILLRIDGSFSTKDATRFDDTVSRGVSVPIDFLIDREGQ